MTPEEWAALEKRIADWDKWRLKKAAEEAAKAAERVKGDAKVDPDDLRKPTTI